MFFRQRPAANATLSYFFGCAGLQKAVAVDVVAGDENWFIEVVVRDLRRADEPWFVITGDTLLVAAVGRPDLAGQEREMAAQLYDTLQTKRLSLPAELEIYPGHQAGSACGAGLSGKPASTLGFEKRFNPMLSMAKEAFVAALTAEIPPQPADMARIVEANLRGIVPDVAHA